MAKASLVLPDGTKVNIEGSADEVATLLARFSGSAPPPRSAKPSRASKSQRVPPSSRGLKRKGPQRLIQDLVQEDYFKAKRTIGEIQKKLEDNGHIYALYSLSTPLLRLTRSKILRRIKDKKGWVYVHYRP